MSGYLNSFDVTKYMSFLNNDEKLLIAYNKVWDKASNIIRNRFDSEPVCNEKYLTTKTKSCGDKHRFSR